MLHTDLMSGVSVETLGAMLVSSIFLAECALGESSLARAASPLGVAKASAQRQDADRDACEQSYGANALRRSERARLRGLSRCFIRAHTRRIIRIRGRR